MITTLIKKESNTKISFNPVELGHSSYYQEFKCKLYNPNSAVKNLYFIDTYSTSIYILLDDVKPIIEEGNYYPYVIFDINGRIEKILLYKEGRKPTTYNYYTRVNHVITLNSSLEFEDFSDIVIRENSYYTLDGQAGGAITSTSYPIIYNDITGDLSIDSGFPDTWVRDTTGDEFITPRNTGDYVKILHSDLPKETALLVGGDVIASPGNSTIDVTTTSGASYNHGIRVQAGQNSAELIHGYNEDGEHIFKLNSTDNKAAFFGLMKDNEVDFVGFGAGADRIVFGGGVLDQIGTNLLTVLGDTVIDTGKLTLDADNIAEYDASPTFTTDNQIVTKKYVDDEIIDLDVSNIAYINKSQTFSLTQTFTFPIKLNGDQIDFSETGSYISYNDVSNTINLYTNSSLRYSQSGSLGLFNTALSTNDETPDVSDGGLCLNQKLNSTNIISLKSSSVSHDMKDLDETDTFGTFKKYSGTLGGLKITSYTETPGVEGMWLQGNVGSGSPSPDRPFGAIIFNGSKRDGTGVNALASGENIFTFCNNSTPLMTISEGTTYLLTTKITVNEQSPDVDSGGICLNQGTGSNNILSLKSSYINHPMTGLDENDTYMTIKKRHSTYGGVQITGYTEANSEEAVSLLGITGGTTPNSGVIEFIGAKYNGGSTRTSIGDTERMVTFSNNYSNKIYIRGNGDIEFSSGTLLNSTTTSSTTLLQSFNVQGIGVLILTSSSTITFRSFNGGQNGQTLKVIHQSTGSLSFTHNYGSGEPIYTNTGTSFSTSVDYGVYMFTYYGGRWYMHS